MKLRWLLACAFLVSCAHGKMGIVDQPLSKGAVGQQTTIYVVPVIVENTNFSGDKAADVARVKEEKVEIADRYHRMIAEELGKKGFRAEAATASPKSGLVLTGKVSKFEHGSAAARIFVGMGAGSSNLFTDFQLADATNGKVLSKFEVIATSGGNGGFQASGSYLKAHLTDGAEKVAEYIAKSNAGEKQK